MSHGPVTIPDDRSGREATLAAIKRGEIPDDGSIVVISVDEKILNAARQMEKERDHWKAKCEERERTISLRDSQERDARDRANAEITNLRGLLARIDAALAQWEKTR